VCVYVNDLAVMMKDPNAFFEELRQRKYKLKVVGDILHHLGGDFYRDPDGTLAWGATKTCCERVVNQCESIFGSPPKEHTSPIDEDDHPELDITAKANSEEIKQCQTLIGCFQWTISLGRYDVFCAAMSMGRFRSSPKTGHLQRLKRICGRLKNILKAPFAFGPKSQIALTPNTLPMIGLAVCVGSLRKRFLPTCLCLEGTPCEHLHSRTPTSCKILPPVDPSQVSFTW
jgi:hypothetical protein